MSELLNLGFKIDISDDTILTTEIKNIRTNIYNSSGKCLAEVNIVNTTDSDIKIRDGIINVFVFPTNIDLELYGDISFFSTKEQVYDICGEPKFHVYTSKDYDYDNEKYDSLKAIRVYETEREQNIKDPDYISTSSYRWCNNYWFTSEKELNYDLGIYEVKNIRYHYLEMTFDDDNNISRVIFAFDPINTENKNENISETLPSNNNSSETQDVNHFDLDGYWHSDDLRYVFRIFTKNRDNGFNTFSYANLRSGKEIQFGTVKKISLYSIKLKSRADSGINLDFDIQNQKLVSDKMTLTRTADSVVNNIIGSWKNEKQEYVFSDDGTYHVNGSTSYWGCYFVIDECNIVLGKASNQLKLYNYTIKDKELIIDKRDPLFRQ